MNLDAAERMDGVRTWVQWLRPKGRGVRHAVIKHEWQYGCYSACGESNLQDPHVSDDSPKCKRCLKLVRP